MLVLGNDEVAALLNGHAALWHPASLLGASGPPKIASPYDHEQPASGQVFAVPDNPPVILPDDWEARVRGVGAVSFRATPVRDTTVSNMLEALKNLSNEPDKTTPLLEWGKEKAAPYFALGFGYRVIEALFEAMEHENVLSTADFWLDIQAALAAGSDPDASRKHLQAAADRLLAAREVLYPVAIHLLDIGFLDELRRLSGLRGALEDGRAFNLLASAKLLEELGRESPDELAAIRRRVAVGEWEVCGGSYGEREDALLPLESQLWNLQKGLLASKEVLAQDVRVYARKRFGTYPQLPMLLSHVGLKRTLLLAFDDSAFPSYRTCVVSWSSPDGKQVDAFTRVPYQSDSPQTFFHWAHYLHKTIAEDHAATLALIHRASPSASGYEELIELSRFGPILGQWTTFSQYFNDVLAGEYITPHSADEFHGDYLTERTQAHVAKPIGWFAHHCRLRRRLDSARTWLAMYRGLAGRDEISQICGDLNALEDAVESGGDSVEDAVAQIEKKTAEMVAERLLSRADERAPGYLLLNPCSFARRVVVELDTAPGPLTQPSPVKTYQIEGGVTWAIVDVPALGFAWMPRGEPSDSPPPSRMRLADARGVRNEFFEAEVDPETGGLRGIRDHRTRINRIGQQLIFNPGSRMRAREIKLVSSGPALGELVSEGEILDEKGEILARFRQRFRAWLGRPVLDLSIEIHPEHGPAGYPWHSYYGARFAWRDERATLVRGVNGSGYNTTHARPETPDYLELRFGRQTTTLFPCGLPFHQRQGGRMLDVILITEGETTRTFELALGLDREYPMQTALGLITPVTVVPTAKGPPHVGSAGWLFHLDAPNVLLTKMWPDANDDAVLFRFLECHSHLVQAELRCVRNPVRASAVDASGSVFNDANVSGDGVLFEAAAGDLVQLRVEFG
jgi:alpha-mannosidase